MNADWGQVDAASTEVLVNTLSLLAPYPPQEKQALLEAPDLKARADVLVALDRSGPAAHVARRQAAAAVTMADIRTDPRLLELLVCPVTKTQAPV